MFRTLVPVIGILLLLSIIGCASPKEQVIYSKTVVGAPSVEGAVLSDMVSVEGTMPTTSCIDGQCSDAAPAMGVLGVGEECGNGILEGGEVCDDGNTEPIGSTPVGSVIVVDTCSADCRGEESDGGLYIGGGLDAGSCEDAGGVVADFCEDGSVQVDYYYNPLLLLCVSQRTVCPEQTPFCRDGGCVGWCGDGVVQATKAESCDDGNVIRGDGCSAYCSIERGFSCSSEPSVCSSDCGDGIVVNGEMCDDGNVVNKDACTNSCQNARCGDGILRTDLSSEMPGFEVCDDGNLLGGDGCDSSCRWEGVCGDGVMQPGEVCDDGNTEPIGSTPVGSVIVVDTCSADCRGEDSDGGAYLGQENIGSCVDRADAFQDSCVNTTVQIEYWYYPRSGSCKRILNDCTGVKGFPFCHIGACVAPFCGDGVVFALEQCDDGNTGDNDSCSAQCMVEEPEGPVFGDEYPVTTHSIGDQYNPAVSVGGDRFVAVWTSNGQDGSLGGIFGRAYYRNGFPATPEFQANSYTENQQQNPEVAVASDGSFIVVWDSMLQDGSEEGIYARRFDAAGAPLGPEVQVNSNSVNAQRNPSIALANDGGFVVVWESSDPDPSRRWEIMGRVFDSAGQPLGDEFYANTNINSPSPFFQLNPDVGIASDGTFVAVWQSFGNDGDGYSIVGRTYASDGSPLTDEFVINEFTFSSQRVPSIAVAGDGAFVVSWESDTQDKDDGLGIIARRYDSTGSPIGSEFIVNTHIDLSQQSASIGLTQAGGFIVAWQSQDQDGSGLGIFSRTYDAAGLPVSPEVQVNSFTTLDQNSPSIGVFPDGSYVTVFESYGQDGSGNGVMGRIFYS